MIWGVGAEAVFVFRKCAKLAFSLIGRVSLVFGPTAFRCGPMDSPRTLGRFEAERVVLGAGAFATGRVVAV